MSFYVLDKQSKPCESYVMKRYDGMPGKRYGLIASSRDRHYPKYSE